MTEFVEIGSPELEAYEEQYFDVQKAHKVIGVFRAAPRNIQAAIDAGWFKEKIKLSDLGPRERVKLSREIDELYQSYVPFGQNGRPTDPND